MDEEIQGYEGASCRVKSDGGIYMKGYPKLTAGLNVKAEANE